MPLIPPTPLIKKVGGTGPDDFTRVGQHFLNIFKEYASLKPHHRVLDVGWWCWTHGHSTPDVPHHRQL